MDTVLASDRPAHNAAKLVEGSWLTRNLEVFIYLFETSYFLH